MKYCFVLFYSNIRAFSQNLELHFGKPVPAVISAMRKLNRNKRSPTF